MKTTETVTFRENLWIGLWKKKVLGDDFFEGGEKPFPQHFSRRARYVVLLRLLSGASKECYA